MQKDNCAFISWSQTDPKTHQILLRRRSCSLQRDYFIASIG